MKKSIFYLVLVAMMAMSCLKENMPEVQDDGVYFTFEAAREALAGSKTVLVKVIR